MGLKVCHLNEAGFSRWDAFVESCSEATFFHRSAWKTVLERAFGHSTHYLYVEQDGEIQGLLPLAQVKSVLFGHTLASLPFCVYGGIIANSDAASIALRNAACELARQLNVDALEMRNVQASGQGWPTKQLYATFRKEIDSDPEANMKAIPRKQRAVVRKGIKAGLMSESDPGWQRLYRIYSESVRNLGTPVFSANYFKILREVFAEDCEILMITHQGQDIAGVMSFYFKDQVLPYYGGSVAQARILKGNDFMYWELLRQSGERGIRTFDFGRSKEGTGPYSFKKNWGFIPEPLSYEYFLVKSKAMPDINPLNPKYRFFVNNWKKLPLPVANFLGPMLSKSLG